MKIKTSDIKSEVLEVHSSPYQTIIFAKSKIKKFFKNFANVKIHKTRLGTFFDYRPYQTFKLPKFVKNFFYRLGMEEIIGENYLVKCSKSETKSSDTFLNVIFELY